MSCSAMSQAQTRRLRTLSQMIVISMFCYCKMASSCFCQKTVHCSEKVSGSQCQNLRMPSGAEVFLKRVYF